MNALTPELLQQITQTVLTTLQTNTYFLPKNSTILLWKSKNLTNAFTLKINEQRLVGLIRTDRTGQNYWKFHEFHEEKENLPNQSALAEAPKAELSAVEKFQQRQQQVQLKENDGKSTNPTESLSS